jgi:CheY-like chemotaxis protein
MNAVIIDDDSAIRVLLGKVLGEKGYEVTSYSSPASCPLFDDAACPCSWAGLCPDLIVSDCDMPDVNGIDFVEHLKRKNCKCKNIAVISGSWTEQDLQGMLPSGVSVFSKPFSLKRFWAWMDKVKEPGEKLACRDNRRSFVRYPCEFPIDVFVSSPGLLENVSAVARNISRGGLLMECSKFLAPMTSCELSFKVPEWMSVKTDLDRLVMVSAQSCRADRVSRTVGLQFLRPLAS